MAGIEQLNGQRLDGIKRKETHKRKQMRQMERRGYVRPGCGTHPGANTGTMHAGTMMRRMLEFMRHRAAGRHSQQGNDGTGHDPHHGFETGCSHSNNSRETKTPSAQINKVAVEASTQLSPRRSATTLAAGNETG